MVLPPADQLTLAVSHFKFEALTVPPTWRAPSALIPPLTRRAPVVELVEAVSDSILMSFKILTVPSFRPMTTGESMADPASLYLVISR